MPIFHSDVLLTLMKPWGLSSSEDILRVRDLRGSIRGGEVGVWARRDGRRVGDVEDVKDAYNYTNLVSQEYFLNRKYSIWIK